MMLSALTGGLGRQGVSTTLDLNPRFTLLVVAAEPAEISVRVLTADIGVLLFDTEDKAYVPPVSSYHPDDE